MRTRNQSKRHPQSLGEEDTKKPRLDSGNQNCVNSVEDNETLANISQEAVGKLLKRVNRRGFRGSKKQASLLDQCDSISKFSTFKLESGLKEKEKQTGVKQNVLGIGCSSRNVIQSTSSKEKAEGGTSQHATNDDAEMDEPDWEDGSVHTIIPPKDHQEGKISSITIELEASPDTVKRKPISRPSAEDKEQAEIVHKVHLLCLLGRGRLIDRACNDPLIQAALLSLVPRQLLKISDTLKLTATTLAPLVNWFHKNFHVRSPDHEERSFESALALALETHEGTAEEVAALSVALFRALNLTTRFVSILDVSSLKPSVDKPESITSNAKRTSSGIFNSSTLMVAPPDLVSGSSASQSALVGKDNVCETSGRHSSKNKVRKTGKTTSQVRDSLVDADRSKDKTSDIQVCEAHNDLSDVCSTEQHKGPKRKSDLEFERQLEMAIAATASGNNKSDRESDQTILQNASPKGMKRVRSEESPSSQGMSVAIGSRKVGAPLYWAEVFCSGENLTGKWVHIDAVNAIIDGEQKVEAAADACKTSLRYAVAFAGHGAKDVTRRYCMKWYKIASQRINFRWWDAVLAPLKELELRATDDILMRQEASNQNEKIKATETLGQSTLESVSGPSKSPVESSVQRSFVASRSSLEDMELETRALTEPLPTNQQAYKNHPLYTLERWLTKYQILHPKGPVLGFCSSRPVYPRTCVQVLHTKERWLREGLQLKASEIPVKVLQRSLKQNKEQAFEIDDYDEGDDHGRDTALYGKWQTEPLQLPRAVNGIVPRNERGQVDVWSEKCLPPGTVHLRLPRLVPIAKRLEIDFAPAMVGFEFLSGRSFPVFEGIVVCAEFKDTILEAYAEEEERRGAEDRRRNELQAISRWYQLLSSIVIRQRLNNRYGGEGSASHSSAHAPNSNVGSDAQVSENKDIKQTSKHQPRNVHDNKENAQRSEPTNDHHEHVFLMDDQTDGKESSTRIKRCHCGFSIEVEEL